MNSWELWRYDFINRWQPDSNSDSSELARQAQLFNNSFEKSEPLSDTPGEGKFESFMNQVAEKLGIDWEQIRNQSENINEEFEDSDESLIPEEEPIETPKKLPLNKSKSKKKKSSLSIATKLYKKEK